MNAYTVAAALAAKFASGTLTPPTGYTAVRVATAAIPNAIPVLPCVLVILPDGEIIAGSPNADITLNFHVQFHYGKNTGDLARDMTAMLQWLTVLLFAAWADPTLGLSGSQQVKSAYPADFRLAVFTYGGEEYYGWDIEWPVICRDVASAA